MNAKGFRLSNIGGVETLKKYLEKNNPDSSGLSLVGFNYTTNKKILSKDLNNGNILIEGSLERFLHMKKHSEAIVASPDLKLNDALASLNYLIVEECSQGFDEVRTWYILIIILSEEFFVSYRLSLNLLHRVVMCPSSSH